MADGWTMAAIRIVSVSTSTAFLVTRISISVSVLSCSLSLSLLFLLLICFLLCFYYVTNHFRHNADRVLDSPMFGCPFNTIPMPTMTAVVLVEAVVLIIIR